MWFVTPLATSREATTTTPSFSFGNACNCVAKPYIAPPWPMLLWPSSSEM